MFVKYSEKINFDSYYERGIWHLKKIIFASNLSTSRVWGFSPRPYFFSDIDLLSYILVLTKRDEY